MSALPILCKVYFRHCRFIFMGYSCAVTFSKQLTDYTATQIIAALNCPRGTAYDWKDGRREPPAWQQPHWLALLQRARPTKGNKTVIPTNASRGSIGAKRKR
jgi:hypothetical protein